MPLADSQYHVKLNGKGYLLVEGSRRKRAQQPFYPRFSTGEYGLTDLSFWQFQGHDAFDGGQGQNGTFLTKNQIKGSTGWDFRDGKARLSLGLSSYGLGSTGPTDTPTQLPARDLTVRPYLVPFGSSQLAQPDLGAMVAITPGAGSQTQINRIATSPEDPTIYQINAYSACVYPRGGAGTQLVVTNGSDGKIYLYSVNSVVLPIVPQVTITPSHAAGQGPIIPVSNDAIIICGATSMVKYTFGASPSWTISSEVVSTIPDGLQILPGILAVDGNSTYYMAAFGTVGGNSTPFGSKSSKIIAMTSTDALNSEGPRISAIYELSNFIIGGLHYVNGVLYAFGAAIKKGSTTVGGVATYGAYQQQIVNALTGEVVWESPYVYAGNSLDNIILTTYQGNPTEAFFVARNYLGSYDGVFRLSGAGQVDEVLALPKTAADSVDWLMLCAMGSRIYVYNKASNLFKSSNVTRGSLDSSGAKAILETSELTGNMPLIKKAPYSVLIELSQALSGGDVLTVVLNGTTLGTIAAADGTSKEIVVPSDLTGTKFNIQIQAAYTVQWDGYVRRLLLKYIPVQVKKKVFGFGVRATRNLRLIDGSAETRDPKTELSDLWAAWASNTPVTFVDIDGTSYTVVITDLDERTDLLNPANGNEIEALAFFEALEV